jgi:hypothetical protein
MTMKYALLVRAAAPAGVSIHLHDPSDATTLRGRDAELRITDGPFADYREPVTGFDVVDADGLEAAVAIAGRLPEAAEGAVEVREVWSGPEVDGPPAPVPADGARRYLFLHANPRDRSGLPASSDESLIDWLQDAHTRRAVLAGDRLRPADAATAATVRLRDGELLISHGPYADLAEEVAGYDVVAAEDLDEAIALARPHPTLAQGAIEIRPLWMT